MSPVVRSGALRTSATTVIALVVVAVVSPVIAGPIDDTGVQERATFAQDVFEDHHGDVVRIELHLDGLDRATVEVRDGDERMATVTVIDRDDDGRVVLSFNTYRAARDDPRTFRALNGDRVTSSDHANLDGLTDGSYDLSIDASSTAEASSDDRATLELRERGLDNLRIWTTLDSERANLTTADGIWAAKAEGRLVNSDAIVERDLLVIAVEAPGILGVLTAQPGPNVTARFFSVLERDDVSLSMMENESTVSTHEHSTILDLTSHRATRVVPDPTNDSYYLVVDLDAVPTIDGSSPDFEALDVFDLNMTFGGESDLTGGERETVTDSITIVPRFTHVFGAEPVYVAPERNQVIAGTVNVPDGTPITLTVESSGVMDLEETRTVLVDEDGRFEAAFDFSGLEIGTEFVVRVQFRGRELHGSPVDGVVDGLEADVEVLDVRKDDAVTVTLNATLDDGGFAVLRAGGTDGVVLDTSRYLDSGHHGQVTLGTTVESDDELVVTLHRDTDDDRHFSGDSAYVKNGSTVTAPLQIGTPGSLSSPTDRESPTDTSAMNRSRSPSNTPPDAPTAPGFGVGVAVLALGVLLARSTIRR